MKRYILYLILGIIAMSVSSCEQVDVGLYQNPPVIQAAQVKMDFVGSGYIDFNVYITLDNSYRKTISGEIKRGTSVEKVKFAHLDDKVYRCDYRVYITEFDTSTIEEGYMKLSSLDISILASDGTDNAISSYTVDEVSCKLPTIESAQCSAYSYTNSYVDFQITVTLDSYVGDYFYIWFMTKNNTESVYLSHIGENVYKTNSHSIYYSDFDSIDYDEGRVKFDNIEIFGCYLYTTNHFVIRNKSYLIKKPSIQVTKVEKEKTEYNNSEGKYHTYYKVYYTVTGTPFLQEAYVYHIGNWINPGKGYSISMSEGSNWQSATVNYSYSNDYCVYVQYRAKTKAGTELISDKAVCLEGTGRGDKYIYLVNSSSIYSTRSSGSKNSDANGAVAGTCYPIIQEANSQVANVAIPVSNQEE
ncbi:MAG: hypothetical protein E7140_00040 [Rikenellaceae bacterium]|nr:hypothetical protein [Rikenellaceae bacterium]